MAFEYTGIRDNVVQTQIRDKGKIATLLLPGTPTSGQPDWDPQPGTPIEQPVWLVTTIVKQEDTADGVVQMTDEVYLVSPENVTLDPTLADRIRVDGKVLQVVRVRPLKPGSVTMLWKVFARR